MAWTDQYIGLPYVYGGREKTGLDCLGLFMLVQREHFGKPMPDYDGPEWRPGADAAAIGKAAEAYASLFEEVPVGKEVEGDAILLRLRGYPLHIGTIVRLGAMLHIHADADACIEDYRRHFWRRRWIGFYRNKARSILTRQLSTGV